MSGTAVEGITGVTGGGPVKGPDEIVRLPGGYLNSSAKRMDELVKQGFQDAQERLGNSGGAALGATPINEGGPLNSAGIEISPSEQIPAQMIDSDPDLESMLDTERQEKTQKTQEAWGNLIKAMKESPVPFFTTSGSKEMLFLIKPTRDPSNPNSEIYVAITKDGPKAIQATKETKGMISKLYLNPTEDPTVNRLETLEMSPLLINEASDPVSSVMKESQEMAAKIGEKRKEISALETSKNLAEKLKGVLNPPQAAPISS